MTLVTLLARGGAAGAQESSQGQVALPSSQVQSSPWEISGRMRAEGVQYPTALPENKKLSQSQSLVGQFRLQKSVGVRSAVDLIAGSNLTMGTSQFGVSEAYVSGTVIDDNSRISLGRKLEYWSLLDSDWQLGLWQPTYGQIDVLRPVDQGLTGIFWQQSEGQHELLAFGTPMFIPSMGPDVKEKNGSIESDSRWYRTPSPTFALRGVATQVVYSIDVPDLSKLVNKPGGALRYRYGGDQKGLWASMNAGYKPINSLLLKYNTVLRVPEVGTRGEVTVSPTVGYHRIWGGDLGYRTEHSMVAVSALSDQPEEHEPTDNAFQQQPEAFRAFGVHGNTELDLPVFGEPVTLTAQYLKIEGGRFHDVDSTKQEQGAIFENRFNFYNALTLKMETRSQVFRKKIISSLKYLRDFDQKGNLIGGDLSLFPARNWVVSLGFDILGVDDEKSTDGSFLNQFRANDRYYGGLSYVF